MTLIERKEQMGGQFNLAMQVPGKEDFNHTLNYFTNELKRLNVDLQLGMNLLTICSINTMMWFLQQAYVRVKPK